MAKLKRILGGTCGVALSLLLTSTVQAGAGASAIDKKSCEAGELRCVHQVVGEMTRRFSDLAKGCDHDAIFALVYLRTTEKYEETAESIGYQNVAAVTREDALFAEYYFRAYDAFHEGRLQDVPPVWQIALSAAQDQSVSTAGNALLGFISHILRDLPFVLYELHQNGTPVTEFDHFKVNDFLAQVQVTGELIERFDATYPTGGDSSFIYFWRFLAWQNYLALKAAPDSATRAAVAETIEQTAVAVALQTIQATSYASSTAAAERNAYCAAQVWPE